MSISGIQGQSLEVTVIGCNNLEDKEWITRQDPYVSLEYGSNKFRTSTRTDGGRNPSFQEKFMFTLIEGLRELTVVVWNSHTLKADEYIGSGRVHLHKALAQGYDDTTWPLLNRTGRHAGEIRLVLHYSNILHCTSAYTPPAQHYSTPPALSQLVPGAYTPTYTPTNTPGVLSQLVPGGSTPMPYNNPYPPQQPYTTSYPPQPYPPPQQTYPPPSHMPAYWPSGTTPTTHYPYPQPPPY